MDGRTQEPLIRWAKERFNVDFVDMINEPGPDLVLLTEDKKFFDYTLKKIKISTEKHGSKRLVIVGHYDCAGNPVSKEEHLKLIKKSIDIAKKHLPEIEISGVYINDNWKVEEI
jgi:hypothetical protein